MKTPHVVAVLAASTALLIGCSSDDSESADSSTTDTTAEPSESTDTRTCEELTGSFQEVSSANPDLPDPELSVDCSGDVLEVTSNGIPNFTYVATTPGEPAAQDLVFRIPVVPTEAEAPGDVPDLGVMGVAVDGVPLYGPTEGTGGDVLSLDDALSECGSHNGPTGFHFHLFGWAEGVDCLYPASEVEAGSVLVGYALDGYPIMSGLVCDDEACASTSQLESSWELTDESLFATDTWAAHSYVEGSGDLDECNGRVDDDGQYRYYSTPDFPYLIGCYRGEVFEDSGMGDGNFDGGAAGGQPVGP